MEQAKESWVSSRVRDRIHEDLVCLPGELHKKDAPQKPNAQRQCILVNWRHQRKTRGWGRWRFYKVPYSLEFSRSGRGRKGQGKRGKVFILFSLVPTKLRSPWRLQRSLGEKGLCRVRLTQPYQLITIINIITRARTKSSCLCALFSSSRNCSFSFPAQRDPVCSAPNFPFNSPSTPYPFSKPEPINGSHSKDKPRFLGWGNQGQSRYVST